jgi:hypothetical protein
MALIASAPAQGVQPYAILNPAWQRIGQGVRVVVLKDEGRVDLAHQFRGTAAGSANAGRGSTGDGSESR